MRYILTSIHEVDSGEFHVIAVADDPAPLKALRAQIVETRRLSQHRLVISTVHDVTAVDADRAINIATGYYSAPPGDWKEYWNRKDDEWELLNPEEAAMFADLFASGVPK